MESLRKSGLRVFDTAPQDTNYEHTLLTTWKITFEKLEEDKQSGPAAMLFKLFAYCEPDDIPLKIFIDGRDEFPPLLADKLKPGDDAGHNELIDKLRRYSLVSMRREDGKMLLSVHRLVQAVVNHNSGGNTECIKCCLNVAYAIFNYGYGTKDDFDTFSINLPHMLRIAHHAESLLEGDKESMEKAARIYSEAGIGLSRKGDYVSALEWYRKALKIREEVLGTEHPLTATTYNNIAGVYKAQGDYASALELYQKAYIIFKKKLGENHPNTKIVFRNAKSAFNAAGYSEGFESCLFKS